MKRSKKYNEKEKLVDKETCYKVDEAIKLLKETAKAKFDETIELTIVLGIDVKKSDQAVRGIMMLPHGTGKTKIVAVIAKGEKVTEAKEAGADFYDSEELIKDISKGKIKFDVLVATPDSMRDLSKLAKTLGPKGLMPSPKTGTVTVEVADAVKKIKTGEVAFRNDESGVIHMSVGRISFEDIKIQQNIESSIGAVLKAKPSAAKGQYLKKIILSSTMGLGIKMVLPSA